MLRDHIVDGFTGEMDKLGFPLGKALLSTGKGLLGAAWEGATAVPKLITAPRKTLTEGVKAMGPLWTPATVGFAAADIAAAKKNNEGAPGYGKAIGRQLGFLAAMPFGGGGWIKPLVAATVGGEVAAKGGELVGKVLQRPKSSLSVRPVSVKPLDMPE